MKKALLTINKILLIVTIGLLMNNNVLAEDKFSIDHNIKYEVQNENSTLIKQTITITNMEDEIIATNYTLNTRYSTITDELGTEADGKNENKIGIKKENTDKGTKLIAIFDKVSIGKGNVKTINLEYKTKDIVTKMGSVTYINIPKSEMTTATKNYNVELVIPAEIGNKLYISPNPQSEKRSGKITTYTFNKEDLKDKGITAAFGSYQTINFKLGYQLKNDNFLSSIYEIALPSDKEGYQQVSYKEITPEPFRIYTDKDGNVMAQYWVESKKKLDVEVTGTAKLVTKQIKSQDGGSFKNIPSSIKNMYTKKQTYWETNSDLVKNLKDKIYNPNENVSQNAQNIYDYIINNFEYEYNLVNKSFIERKGANNTLTIKEPVSCMEFTDLFVTLARSMGIPAREINGYAITSDNVNAPSSINLKGGDLLHAWAEFYDPNFGWVSVDPTWGNTSKIDYFSKLDTNHFAFVTKGLNSEYPLPAGLYRYENNTKLINIDFTITAASDFDTKLSIKKIFNFSPIHAILGYNRYEVENSGSVFVYNVNHKTLAPGQKTSLFIKRDINKIYFKDFNDKESFVEF